MVASVDMPTSGVTATGQQASAAPEPSIAGVRLPFLDALTFLDALKQETWKAMASQGSGPGDTLHLIPSPKVSFGSLTRAAEDVQKLVARSSTKGALEANQAEVAKALEKLRLALQKGESSADQVSQVHALERCAAGLEAELKALG